MFITGKFMFLGTKLPLLFTIKDLPKNCGFGSLIPNNTFIVGAKSNKLPKILHFVPT